MLNICSPEFDITELEFNVAKCVALFVGKSVGHVVKELALYGNVIPHAKRYLGVMSTTDLKWGVDVTNQLLKFIGSITSVC